VSFVSAELAGRALGDDRLDMLRSLPGLTIGAVAGRDAVAAIVQAVRGEGFSAVLPTSVATGTEYGDSDAPLDAVRVVRETLGDDAEVLDPLRVGSPRLWAALNGRFAAEIDARFGLHSACLACHLYVHMARVPLAWALGNAPVVTGERDTHDGRVKLSQTEASIDAETRVLAYAGIELLTPVRTASGAEVGALVPGWREGERQLCCVHSGNYKRLDGSVHLDATGYHRYLTEFFEPAGRGIVDAWRAAGLDRAGAADSAGVAALDYEAIVRRVLET
jgi:hypothetical protein